MSQNSTGPRGRPVGPQPEHRRKLLLDSRQRKGALPQPIVISSELVLWRLVVPEGKAVPLQGDLWYKSTDPYAVRLTFYVGDDTLDWVFARSLLIGGLNEPTGTGDVEVGPSRHRGADTVQITLRTSEACAVLEAPARVIAAFLERSCAAVPPGTEHRHLDLDHVARQFIQDID